MSTAKGVFSLDDLREALSQHEGELSEYGDSAALEQLARTRRWLDEGGDRALFADAAAQLERNWRENGTAGRGSWAESGGLWHLAGENDKARSALQKAVADGTDWEPAPQGAAGVLYLLGEYDRAARLAPDDPEGWMAVAARDRTTDPLEQARERWIGWARLGRSGPHHGSNPIPLSRWDWIEETYRLEARLLGQREPSHLEMLRRTGLLRQREEPCQPAMARPALRAGFCARLDEESGGATLDVRNEGLAVATLPPDWTLKLQHSPADGGWGVQLANGPDGGDWILSPSEPNFQSAGLWAAEWLGLRGASEAGEHLRRLVDIHDHTD